MSSRTHTHNTPLVLRIASAWVACLLFMALPAVAQTSSAAPQETAVSYYQPHDGIAPAASGDACDVVITNSKLFGIGRESMQDTYLSPEHYSGPEVRYTSVTMRVRPDRRWSTMMINEGYVANGKSRSENGSMMSGAYRFQYGRLYRLPQLLEGLSLKAGVQGELLGGFIYSTRNGNNPAQARAMIDVGPVLTAAYRVWRLDISYTASCPLAGLTFSPNYGQSYYEIFDRGNYDHNIVPTTIVSTPSLRHQLMIRLKTSHHNNLTVGYLGDYQQQSVNNLKQHLYTHAFVIGVTHTFVAGRRYK